MTKVKLAGSETLPTLMEPNLTLTSFEEETVLRSVDRALVSPMPLWEIVCTVLSLSVIIVFTIVGNILVIMSVFTYRPLRIVQNFFIVSLAVADITVAVFVLPFNVAYSILGKWVFGIHMCQMWLTCDIMCCTASILNLCAIALDRYWAITNPISYAQKRTLKRVLGMIALVWAISVIICLPPLFGWNDWPDDFTEDTPCILTGEKGFVIYSSSGSFYCPLLIMTIVYIKIFTATKRRLRDRAKASSTLSHMTFPGKSRMSRADSVMSDNSAQNGYHESYKQKLVQKKKKKKKRKLSETADRYSVGRGSLIPPPIAETSGVDNDPDFANDDDRPPIDSPPIEVEKRSSVLKKVNSDTENNIHQFIEEKQRISLSKERRAARTLGIIMGSFVICWLPFFLMYVILPFCPSCAQPSNKVVNFIVWLGYINSSLNPVIYTIFNLDFRRAFAKILRCPNAVAV